MHLELISLPRVGKKPLRLEVRLEAEGAWGVMAIANRGSGKRDSVCVYQMPGTDVKAPHLFTRVVPPTALQVATVTSFYRLLEQGARIPLPKRF